MKKKDWMQPCMEGSQVLEEIVEEMYLTSWEVLGYYFV